MILMATFFNLLAPGRCGFNLRLVIFQLISRIDIMTICSAIAHSQIPQDITNKKSKVVHYAITWADADPDLCCHMASFSPDELK